MPTLNAFKLHEGMTEQTQPTSPRLFALWRGLVAVTENDPVHREALFNIAELAFGLSRLGVMAMASFEIRGPQLAGSDRSLAEFWRRANDAAVELNTCDVFEQVMYVMSGLTRGDETHLAHLTPMMARAT